LRRHVAAEERFLAETDFGQATCCCQGDVTQKGLFAMPKSLIITALMALVLGIGGANAAETGTKTMPDSSIYPPPTRPVVFWTVSHDECYLPSEPCDNRHRVNN
jgi:hypothetical protein